MLYLQAVPCVQGIDNLFEKFLNDAKQQKSTTINLAANHVSISYILPKYIKKFKDMNSQVKFEIRNLTKDNAIKRLIDDEIDMFIYPIIQDEVPPELDFIPIFTYQPILLIRKDHPLAKKRSINLSDVKKYELVRIDPKFITLPAFEEIIKSHGLKTYIEFEMSDWEILKRFVNAGIGVAMISNIVLEGEKNSNLIGRILTNYFPEMVYGILLKKGKNFSGLSKDFIKMLRTEKLLEAQKLELKNFEY
jgi:LysR family cys regulon transcriptional activator